ncbi:hypothetical protein DERF_005706 [Dermatophagoides farinae]|uniref:Uncharacterized protein n=1 Tax=Dermatophagoides farinae TaxID=6954 RepID=A0A922I6D1_DERFA|nr:hypothetical protein DERF_005706 [Dermatophagoides farinae]
MNESKGFSYLFQIKIYNSVIFSLFLSRCNFNQEFFFAKYCLLSLVNLVGRIVLVVDVRS